MWWLKLRRKQLKGHQFYRQKIIGKYIVDFYCPKANLVIELDGGQHYSEIGKAKDRIRDKVLVEMGMEPHGQSPWYLHKIPSYACLRVAASAKAGQGFGGLSAFSEIRRSSNTSAHD
jgi:hypothetical protein